MELIGSSIATIILPVCPPLAATVAITDIVALGVIGFVTCLIHKKSKHNNHDDRYSSYPNGSNYCSCGGKPPKHEDDEDNHPNGIYEGAEYHHCKSQGKKSPAPKDGQTCLDHSLSIKNNLAQRVGLEGDKFVIFKQTARGKFHGYCMTWKEIVSGGNPFTESVRQTLIDNRWVTRSGKIIRNGYK